MVNFKKLLINYNSKIIDALNVIEKGASQIALVTDDSGRLVGILSDGDIRRGLLKGESLDSNVNKIMCKNYISINQYTNKNDLNKLMRSKGIRHLPMIDNKGFIKDLILLEELFKDPKLLNPIVIMAGGKGKRLMPFTEKCPKPMLEINGKPMLGIILENCISNGFNNFYISVNYQKEKIIKYFRDGSSLGINISYLIEDEPLGTAGSLNLLPKNIQEPLIVINADVLTSFNLINILRFHRENNAMATVGVRNYELNVPFGVISKKGIELDSFHEKPSFSYLVNTGIYVLNPDALSYIPSDQYIDMPNLLEEIKSKKGKVVVCPIHEYWLDVGRPESLEKANNDWIFS